MTRDILPSEKDPDAKFGIWEIIKDQMGKELHKVIVPVFLNIPLSVL